MKYYHINLAPRILSPFHINFVYDRTSKFFKNFEELEIITPIGEICEPKTIDEICFDNVSYIKNKSASKKIYIAWSGGIDSTLVLCEFLKYTKNDQICVLLNSNSIAEYPLFYEKYIKDKLETKQISYFNNDTLLECVKDGVIVTGMIIDTLFGENSYSNIPKEKLLESPLTFISKLSKESQRHYTDMLKSCPREIENVKDIFWWMSYSLAYQGEQISWILDCEKLIPDKNFFNFGDTKLWNDYSMSTPAELKWPGTELTSYKFVLKKQIETLTHDEEYTKNKIKIPSWRKYRKNKKDAARITTEWIHIYE